MSRGYDTLFDGASSAASRLTSNRRPKLWPSSVSEMRAGVDHGGGSDAARGAPNCLNGTGSVSLRAMRSANGRGGVASGPVHSAASAGSSRAAPTSSLDDTDDLFELNQRRRRAPGSARGSPLNELDAHVDHILDDENNIIRNRMTEARLFGAPATVYPRVEVQRAGARQFLQKAPRARARAMARAGPARPPAARASSGSGGSQGHIYPLWTPAPAANSGGGGSQGHIYPLWAPAPAAKAAPAPWRWVG